MMDRVITCVLCPNGCELDVAYDDKPTEESVAVEGNLCPKGVAYAVEELVRPRRTLTTSVQVLGSSQRLVSVKTASPIPCQDVLVARKELMGIVLDAPVSIGDVVIGNVAGTGVDVVATRAADRTLRTGRRQL